VYAVTAKEQKTAEEGEITIGGKCSMQVGLGPGDVMLDGDPAPPMESGTAAASLLFGLLCSSMVAHLNCC